MATPIWKGQLAFGLVSFPVKLIPAARREGVHFRRLHRTDQSPVRQVLYCERENKPVPQNELARGYEYEPGRFVIVEDEELKAIEPKSSKLMEISQFVKLSEVDPIYLDTSYYLHPDEGGEKPYHLLMEAMRRVGAAAVARLTMHGREHVVLVRPANTGLVVHTLYYHDEVRANEEFKGQTVRVEPKELELAVMLVEALMGRFQPEAFQDTYRAELERLLQAKVQGEKVAEVAVEERAAPVMDILEALKASLSQVKKPPVSAVTATVETSAKEESVSRARRVSKSRTSRG